MNFSFIQKLIVGGKSTVKNSAKEGYYDPVFHWELVLLFFFVMIIVGAAVSLTFFVSVNRPVIPEGEVALKSKSFDEEQLTRVLSYFNKKEETLKSLREAKPVFRDPSFPR